MNKKKIYQNEFDKHINQLKNNVDKSFEPIQNKRQLGSRKGYVFLDAIDLKFAVAICVTRDELDREPKELMKCKIQQAVLALIGILEDETEKLIQYSKEWKQKKQRIANCPKCYEKKGQLVYLCNDGTCSNKDCDYIYSGEIAPDGF